MTANPIQPSGEQCKRVREALGLNVDRWARLLGVDRVTVWRWERAGEGIPTLNEHARRVLCGALRRIAEREKNGWHSHEYAGGVLCSLMDDRGPLYAHAYLLRWIIAEIE